MGVSTLDAKFQPSACALISSKLVPAGVQREQIVIVRSIYESRALRRSTYCCYEHCSVCAEDPPRGPAPTYVGKHT